jgi:hypothetical protein
MTRPALNVALLITVALLLLASCVRPPKVAPVGLAADTATGESLWRYIAEDGDYRTWPMWPGHEGIQPGQSPHGRYHEIHISPSLAKALPIPERKAPPGSVVVKRNLDAAKKLVGYTVIAKLEGYDPPHGDWFWASYGPDGATKAAGKVAMCIACHEGMKANDYIIVHPLDEGGGAR